jgi:hypothetical protein
MWPAAVMAGMLVLLGAIGTAKAPVAQAAAGDICTSANAPAGSTGILGPFPNFGAYYGDSTDGNLLLQGKEYLFIVVVEDQAIGGTGINVSVDDEEGDADIETYADASNNAADAPGTIVNGAQTFLDLPGSGTDSVDQIDNVTYASWNLPSVAPVVNQFIEGVDEDWDGPAGMATGPALTSYTNADGFTLATSYCGVAGTQDGLSFITVTCDEAGEFEITAFEDAETDNVVTNDYICYNAPTTVTLTATPTTVEAVPAAGNISHSLLVLTITDSAGQPTVPGWAVDWTVGGRCVIDALTESQYETANGYWLAYKITNPGTGANIENAYGDNTDLSTGAPLTASSTANSFNIDGSTAPGYQPKSIAAAILHCGGATPGVASVRAELDRSPSSDLSATVDVTVVGPPAFITMTAAPSKLICGEKATILVTVTDAINQKVSDHTVVELITNYGGVIGGTGGTLGFPGWGPVNPLSSGAAETFGGVATAYLLTSTAHVGSYEVVASAGGSNLGYYGIEGQYVRNGYFSTPVVTSQVTVTCTEGAPAVTAPSTGTGTISPPNTGDAGLAATSGSNAMLYVIAGAIAFVMAGLASIRYARR